MSHTARPIFPGKITLETLPDVIAFHRSLFGGMTMLDPPEGPAGDPPPAVRPEDVPEIEWNALGDPGRVLITREREARRSAERALAAARARPGPPKPADAPANEPAGPSTPAGAPPSGDDLAKIINDAVAAAVKPFAARDAQRDAATAAQTITDKVLAAAEAKFVDATDGLGGIDLTQVTDGNGSADEAKITAALDELLTRKPHLGKVIDPRRQALPGGAAGASSTSVPLETRVQDTLKEMQASTGIRPTKP